MPDREKVEFIESYIKIGNGDYQWSDNHGELVRCKDCIHYDMDENSELGTCLENGVCSTQDWFCADGERS